MISFRRALATSVLYLCFLLPVFPGPAQSGKKPAILMVHGLSGSYTKWNDLITYLPNERFATGGSFDICSNATSKDPDVINLDRTKLIPKQSYISDDERYMIYTLSFLNNQGLSFAQQGRGVRNAVNWIVNMEGRDEVILVAHSMGGLASRACILQNSSNIVGLLTAASPHVGSYCGLISEYYAEHSLTSEQRNGYAEFAFDVTNILGNAVTVTNTDDLIKYAAAWDAIEFTDGTTLLHYLWEQIELGNTPKAELLNLITQGVNGLSLDAPALKYLVPSSQEMLELYRQKLPADLPVSVILSTWEQSKGSPAMMAAANGVEYMFMFAHAEEYLRLAKNNNNVSLNVLMGTIEQELKKEYLEKGEDLYPPSGDYYLYTDGIVTTFSQDILNGISNPEEISNIAYFGTNLFHTDVPKDVEVMHQAMEFVMNSRGKKVKVGLILDSSGSMSSNDPDNVRIKAGESVLGILQNGDEVFIVDFDDQAIFLNQDHTRVEYGNQLSQYIRMIDSNGGTDIGAGLSKMKDALLSGYGSNFHTTGVLLLTDGQGDYNGEAEWFHQHHIPVFTISYKEYADAALMDSIAHYTEGLYIRANDEMDVFQAFNQFYNELSGYSTIYRMRFLSNGFQSQPVYVDETASEMIVYLNGLVTDPENIAYIDPSKQRHSLAEATTFISGNNYMYARIDISSPGYYTFFSDPTSSAYYSMETDLDYKSIPGPSDASTTLSSREEYTLELSTNTKIGIDIDIEENRNGFYSVSFTEENESLQAGESSSEIIITSPSGKTSLHKNRSDDGSVSFVPMEGKGNYNVEANFSGLDIGGKQVNRHYLRSVLVGDFKPGYIGEVNRVMGGYIYTSQGLMTRNRPGISIQVFKKGSSLEKPFATGYVTEANTDGCIIELQQLNGIVSEGDIVILDLLQWKGD